MPQGIPKNSQRVNSRDPDHLTNPLLRRAMISAAQPSRKKKVNFQPIEVDIPYSEDDWKTAFLVQLAQFPNVSQACLAARISRKTAYKIRAEQPVFAQLWKEIEEAATDQLVQKCWERAMNPFDPGSATLAIFMLKSHRPEVYNPPRVLQAQHEYATKDGKPVQISIRRVDYQNYLEELAPPGANQYQDDEEEEAQHVAEILDVSSRVISHA